MCTPRRVPFSHSQTGMLTVALVLGLVSSATAFSALPPTDPPLEVSVQCSKQCRTDASGTPRTCLDWKTIGLQCSEMQELGCDCAGCCDEPLSSPPSPPSPPSSPPSMPKYYNRESMEYPLYSKFEAPWDFWPYFVAAVSAQHDLLPHGTSPMPLAVLHIAWQSSLPLAYPPYSPYARPAPPSLSRRMVRVCVILYTDLAELALCVSPRSSATYRHLRSAFPVDRCFI